MKEKFKEHRFQKKSRELLAAIDDILARYEPLGYDLTDRQLFYQLVAAVILENSERPYKNLCELVKNARLAGLIDWAMISDRGRSTVWSPHWDSPAAMIAEDAEVFLLDKWQDQPVYIEVLVEKQALEGVLIPVCAALDVRFSATRGNSSTTLFYDIGQRLGAAAAWGKEPVVLFFADHDPTGIHMSQDAEERLSLLARTRVRLKRLALNIDQVTLYRLPPNTAKTEDTRYKDYAANFGTESWELDALDPQVIAGLVTEAVNELRDGPRWQAALEREAAMKEELRQYADEYRE